MTDRTDDVRRRDYLELAGGVAAASTIGLAGCLGSDDDGDGDGGGNGGDEEATGTLATQVTDQPGDIADFESCVVTIQGIWVKPNDTDESDDSDGSDDAESEGENTDGEESDGGNESDGDATADEGSETDDEIDEQREEDVDQSDERRYYEFDEPQQADLVDLQGENTQLVDERELPVGEYAFLQLDVTDVEGTLAEGGETEVSTPGNAPLQFKESFEIRDGKLTTFLADFTPVRRGQTGTYLLQPVATGTEVSYEDVPEDGETGDDGEDSDDQTGTESDAQDGTSDDTQNGTDDDAQNDSSDGDQNA